MCANEEEWTYKQLGSNKFFFFLFDQQFQHISEMKLTANIDFYSSLGGGGVSHMTYRGHATLLKIYYSKAYNSRFWVHFFCNKPKRLGPLFGQPSGTSPSFRYQCYRFVWYTCCSVCSFQVVNLLRFIHTKLCHVYQVSCV